MPSPRTALVTGSTSGIGRATAVRLAATGAHVLVHGRDDARGKQVVEEIVAAGGAAELIVADLVTTDGVHELVRQVEQAVGTPDVLVNNAGVYAFGPSVALDEAGFDAMFDLNVKALYFLSTALLPKMAARGSGSVVNITTAAAQLGVSYAAAYGASKAAVELLTRAWAAEHGPAGVRVNAVSPGPVITGGTAAFADGLRESTKGLPLGRPGLAEEVAAAVAFLAGSDAAFVCGASLAVDGGAAAVLTSL